MGKKKLTRFLLVTVGIIFGLFLVSSVCYAIPNTINYQGYLTDAEGYPLDGTVDMVFALYDVDTGGSPLWSETQTGVDVTEGIFSVNLGSATPITLPFDTQYYLGITVGADAEMTPRQPITSVGYAYRAGEADAVAAGGVDSSMLAEDAVTADKIDDGAVQTAHLDTGAVTADKLHDDAVTSAKIVDNSVTYNDIVDGPSSGLDADLLDGYDSSAFMAADADNWVDEAGDTMSGTLNVPENGLSAGTDQLVLANGNVGIGESSPEEKLEVQGNVKVSGGGNGIIFPDDTKQTTAVSGGGVPSGYMILGNTPTAPPGYTYVGPLVGGEAWRSRAPMSTARRYLTAVQAGGKIYAIGGYNSANGYQTANEEYDPVTNSWATKSDMPTARSSLAAAAAGGKIYAIGGLSSTTGYETANKEYDPVADSWATKAPMPTGRSRLAAAAAGGKIYAIGGDSSATTYETANEEYDPVADSWAAKAPMPTGRRYLTAVQAGGKIYAIGGLSFTTTYETANEEYDPVADSWAAKAPMPTGRYGPAAASIGGKIYAIGGYSSSGRETANEEYDPVADSWAAKAPMPTGRYGPAAASIGGKIYAIGGNSSSGYETANEEYDPRPTYHLHQKD